MTATIAKGTASASASAIVAQAMKYDCVDLVIMGMDTHACPECRDDSPENF